jgi:hypothetical protein
VASVGIYRESGITQSRGNQQQEKEGKEAAHPIGFQGMHWCANRVQLEGGGLGSMTASFEDC